MSLQILCTFDQIPATATTTAGGEEGAAGGADVLEVCLRAEQIPASLDQASRRFNVDM